MLVVQLDDVIVCQEAKALDSDIRVKSAALSFDEATDIQWQEFQVVICYITCSCRNNSPVDTHHV